MRLDARKAADSVFVLTIGAVLLAVFAKFWETGIGISSASYGALAFSLVGDGHWFHPVLGPGIFDPFVDHPYLALWMHAAIFKIFGASAQTVRLAGSFAGLATFISLFIAARARFGERVAFLSCVCLMLCNVFMNFISSGWLDMPMIGWVWVGFCCLDLAQERGKSTLAAIGGFALGLAVLAKGASAVAVIPILLAVFLRDVRKQNDGKSLRSRVWIIAWLAFAAPIALFTWAHWLNEGFFFWSAYLARQGGALNDTGKQAELSAHLWYLVEAARFGHLVLVASLFGLLQLYRTGQRRFFWLIVSEFVIHTVFYAFSSRHYAQYVIPIFPWLSLAAGVWLSNVWSRIRPNASTLPAARGLFALMLVFFVAVDLLPIRVHSGNENPFRAFVASLHELRDNGRVLFFADANDQSTWEDIAAYIPWYWKRTPIMNGDAGDIVRKIGSTDATSLGLFTAEDYEAKAHGEMTANPGVIECMRNDVYVLIANAKLCSDAFRALRPRQEPRQSFER